MSGSRGALESGLGTQTADAFPHSGMLIKRDRPRSIDRYIDYFGDTGKAADSDAFAAVTATPRASEGGRRQ